MPNGAPPPDLVTTRWGGRLYQVDLRGLRQSLMERMAIDNLTFGEVADLAGVSRVTLWRFLNCGLPIRQPSAIAIAVKGIGACWHDHLVGCTPLPSRCHFCPLRHLEHDVPALRVLPELVPDPNLDDTSRIDVWSSRLAANPEEEVI